MNGLLSLTTCHCGCCMYNIRCSTMTMHGCTYVQPLNYQGVFATSAGIQIRACVLLRADLGQVASKMDAPNSQTSKLLMSAAWKRNPETMMDHGDLRGSCLMVFDGFCLSPRNDLALPEAEVGVPRIRSSAGEFSQQSSCGTIWSSKKELSNMAHV